MRYSHQEYVGEIRKPIRSGPKKIQKNTRSFKTSNLFSKTIGLDTGLVSDSCYVMHGICAERSPCPLCSQISIAGDVAETLRRLLGIVFD